MGIRCRQLLYYSLNANICDKNNTSTLFPRWSAFPQGRVDLILNQILNHISKKTKINRKILSLQLTKTGFHKILKEMLENFPQTYKMKSLYQSETTTIPKILVLREIEKVTDKVIPKSFFGNCKNKRHFNHILRRIIFSYRGEFTYQKFLIQNWNLDKISYLKNVQYPKIVMKHIVIFMLEHYVKPLITSRYAVTRVCPTQGHEIHFFSLREFNKWKRTVFNQMRNQKKITPNSKQECEKFYCGNLNILPKTKNLKEFHFRAVSDKMKAYKYKKYPVYQSISKYLYIPKEKRHKINSFLLKLSDLQFASHKGNFPKLWTNFVQTDKYLYGFTADIRDAFGTVKIDDLIKIIHTRFGMLDQQDQLRYRHLLQIIIDKVNCQILGYHQELRKKKPKHGFFNWNHGIIQGFPFSSALHELYRSAKDFEMMEKINIQDKEFLFHRNVDDYIIISTDSDLCMQIKTELEKQVLKSAILSTRILKYCGKSYDLDTKSVSLELTYPEFHKDKWKLWNPLYEERLSNRLLKNFMLTFHRNEVILDPVFYNPRLNNNLKIRDNFRVATECLAFKFHSGIHQVYLKLEDRLSNRLSKIVDLLCNSVCKRVMICFIGERQVFTNSELKKFFYQTFVETLLNFAETDNSNKSYTSLIRKLRLKTRFVKYLEKQERK